MPKTVIEIEHLYKEYRLGLIGYGTLHEDLQSWWARIQGKEDPNSKLFSGNQSRHGKTSDHILALNDINLTVKQGERLGIIGKNGAGKTTLLKVLSRIASPTKGTARINGRVASLLAVGTGFHRELTGRENIYINGSILGLRNFEIDERFDEIVDFAGVEQFIDTPVKRYSSGMYIRLGFAVAAHLDPNVLIVDEVLAVGDAEFQKKAIGKMKSVSKEQGRTVLFVSHNMQMIEALCNKTILFEKGSIVAKGKSPEVILKYFEMIRNSSFDGAIEKRSVGDGKAQLAEVKLIDEKDHERFHFEIGEKIRFLIEYEVFEEVKNLKIQIDLLSEKSREAIASLQHTLSSNPLKAGHKDKAVIEFSTEKFRPQTIELSFWLGQEGVKGRCDAIEGLGTPLLLTSSSFQRAVGFINLESRLIPQ